MLSSTLALCLTTMVSFSASRRGCFRLMTTPVKAFRTREHSATSRMTRVSAGGRARAKPATRMEGMAQTAPVMM